MEIGLDLSKLTNYVYANIKKNYEKQNRNFTTRTSHLRKD